MKKNVYEGEKAACFDKNLAEIEQLLAEIEQPSIKLADLEIKNVQISHLLTVCEQQLKKAEQKG
jgi:exonuclease VII small subunit